MTLRLIHSLPDLVTSHDWDFLHVFPGDGGLSLIELFSREGATRVPEPMTLALFALGLLGFGFARRRRM